MKENIDCRPVLSLTEKFHRSSVPLCIRSNNKLISRYYIEILLRFTRRRTYMSVCILVSSFRRCNVGIKSLYIRHIKTYLQKYDSFFIFSAYQSLYMISIPVVRLNQSCILISIINFSKKRPRTSIIIEQFRK